MSKILQGDSLHVLKDMPDNSIDLILTDPPYGYSFMGKDWDKAVPSVEIWQECLRVLKPGAFINVMSAPRSDVQMHMIKNISDAGFRVDFTPIYWTYASGFPKAGNIGKLVDKRLGAEREVISKEFHRKQSSSGGILNRVDTPRYKTIDKPNSDQAKALDGSYAGFQPKPAVEVIIVAMKPLSEKTYVDQALANGKGISWLDDGRIPTDTPVDSRVGHSGFPVSDAENSRPLVTSSQGRFPANLLVSDDVLNDGVERVSKYGTQKVDGKEYMGKNNAQSSNKYTGDRGSYSRYFDLDKWASTLPFLITPKASKSEKNKGLEHLEAKRSTYRQGDDTAANTIRERLHNSIPKANHHPTVKPLKLMSYLITLFSRPGDAVLDPFVGSGTTVVAAKKLDRIGIGIEREPEYAEIARARLLHEMPQLPPEKPEPAEPPVTLENLTQARLFE